MTYYKVPLKFVTVKEVIVIADSEDDAKVAAMGLDLISEETVETIDWDLASDRQITKPTYEELLHKNIPWI